MQGATGPGGRECHAKDSSCVLLTPVDFGEALEGFVRRWPVATSLMTFPHVGKSLLLEKAMREEENEPVTEPRGAVGDTRGEGGCNVMETERRKFQEGENGQQCDC